MPCSTMSTAFVLAILAPTVRQSRLARSRKRRSMSSASTPVCSIACRACSTIERYVSTVTSLPSRRTAAVPNGIW